MELIHRALPYVVVGGWIFTFLAALLLPFRYKSMSKKSIVDFCIVIVVAIVAMAILTVIAT